MATKFVYSAASGANDGSSWTDAWTSIASATGVAAGDIVKVEYRHSNTALTANVDFSNGTLIAPVRIVSVDKDNSDALRTGATLPFTTTTGVGLVGNIFVYGVTQTQSAAIMRNNPPSRGVQTYESCTFAPTGSTGLQFGDASTTGWAVRLTNCTYDLSGGSGTGVLLSLTNLNSSSFEWIGGTFTMRSSQTNAIAIPNGSLITLLRIVGVSFSGTVTNIFSAGSNAGGLIEISRCVPPTYTNVYSTLPTNDRIRCHLDGFVSGTITAPLLPPTQIAAFRGNIATSLSQYRTGGADDGEQANAYSWELVSNASAADFVAPLVCPPMVRWVDTGSQTVTVFVASGTTLQDDEFWIEVVSPSEAGSATAQAKYQTTRPALLATPANLTTDGTSTWNGSGVGTKQKVSVSINPTVPGPITVRVYFAKASTTVYVDPRIDVA